MREQETIAAAAAKFPREFGLRAFPGDTFKISESLSYIDNGVVRLYAARLTNPGAAQPRWEAFYEGTLSELWGAITAAPELPPTV